MIDFPLTARQRFVLSLIRESGSVTRAEIQLRTGLSASRVSRLTGELLDSGVIAIEERLSHGEGRPQEVLAIAPGQRYVVGLDVGGLKQDVAISDLRGDAVRITSSRRTLTGPRTKILDSMQELVEQILGETGIDPAAVLGLGVGLRAIVDPVTGIISAGPEAPSWSPSWTNFAIRDELSALMPRRMIVVDDIVRARAVAERRLGNSVRGDDFVFVLADSGIGAALMINGKPYIGSLHLAGEIGHVTIDPDGPLCGCGKHGCVEAYASSIALLERARRETDDAGLELSTLIAGAEQGLEPHRRILSEGGAVLGRSLAILVNLLSPGTVVIGGALAESRVYCQTAIETARNETVGRVRERVRFLTSAKHTHAGVLGACSMVLDTLFAPQAI